MTHDDHLRSLITPRTRVLSFTHLTNTQGDLFPAAELCRLARERGILSLVDGAQKSADYRALNPQGLVPMLEIDGHRLTQSLAIINYLDLRFPIFPLIPALAAGTIGWRRRHANPASRPRSGSVPRWSPGRAGTAAGSWSVAGRRGTLLSCRQARWPARACSVPCPNPSRTASGPHRIGTSTPSAPPAPEHCRCPFRVATSSPRPPPRAPAW